MSCSRRGPLRHVCGSTIYPTAMICTFLESQTNLDVHPGKRFALFGQNRRNWHRRNRHQKQRHLLFATELFTLELCFYIYCISEFWHTGDNVRLSDVVKFASENEIWTTTEMIWKQQWRHGAMVAADDFWGVHTLTFFFEVIAKLEYRGLTCIDVKGDHTEK